MNNRVVYAVIGVLVVVLLGAIGYYWWQQRKPPLPYVPPVVQAPLPPAAVPPPAPPAIQHPIENVTPPAGAGAPLAIPDEPAQADAVVQKSLIELLGRNAVFAFLNTDGFARRVVATVDNLPRKQASTLVWPVVPTGGRFTTDKRGEEVMLGADNAKRYAPFVKFIESTDTKRAVQLYVRLYPQFQKAYEELGYPGKYFNDRLIETIDHLLATPELKAAPQLALPEFKGPVQPTRPWVLIEYADPELEARSAGQKVLMRMGNANAERLKAKLVEFRRQIASGGATR